MAYHVRFTIFRATITNSLNEEKLTKHKSDFASIFLTQPIRNDVMDFDKFEKIFHHRNKLEPQRHNECLPLTSDFNLKFQRERNLENHFNVCRLLAANVEVILQISLS